MVTARKRDLTASSVHSSPSVMTKSTDQVGLCQASDSVRQTYSCSPAKKAPVKQVHLVTPEMHRRLLVFPVMLLLAMGSDLSALRSVK